MLVPFIMFRGDMMEDMTMWTGRVLINNTTYEII